MPYIEYTPEIIYSKLGPKVGNYPLLIEPKTTIRDSSIAFEITAIFQTKEVFAPLGNSRYYLGIRNGIIEMNGENAQCFEATNDILYDVSYEATTSRSDEKKEKNSGESSISHTPLAGKFSSELSTEESIGKMNVGKFTTQEKKLSCKVVVGSVRWVYSLPNNNSLVSDVLDEVLPLKASFRWDLKPLKGMITLRPGTIEVFDAERKMRPPFQGVGISLLLAFKKVNFHDAPIHLNYQVF